MQTYNQWYFDEVILQQCLDILIEARQLISNPGDWSKKSSWSDPANDGYSAYDTIEVAAVVKLGFPKSRIFAVINLLEDWYYPEYKSLSDFNARNSHSEVLELFDKTIEQTKYKLQELQTKLKQNKITCTDLVYAKQDSKLLVERTE